MAKPTLTPAPNDPPVLGSPSFAADAQGYLGWFPVMGQYMQDMGDWIETMIGDVPSDNIAAFAHLNGAANKLPYFTGAGAMAMADLTADGRSLIGQSGVLKANGGLLTGTGVTQSKFDATAGRLLKAGDNGILGAVVNAATLGISSLDDAPIGSLINCYPITTNLPGSATIGIVATMAIDNGNAYQEFTPIYPTSALKQRYFRHRMFDVWTEWTAMYPERGSNSNGYYVKHANGDLECHLNTFKLAYSSGPVCVSDWTFPYAFSTFYNAIGTIDAGGTSLPNGSASISSIGAVQWANSGANLTTARMQVRCIPTVAFASGDYVTVRLSAWGRWK
ncbi:hypothetical protein ABEB22_10810 [Thioclava sp. 'Guangxiensis']|uniref:hypothetical protein n=1 Tax=Thioclava sp. 'Guangxiensis' TaxID=3149044 RepID=UPI0038778F94